LEVEVEVHQSLLLVEVVEHQNQGMEEEVAVVVEHRGLEQAAEVEVPVVENQSLEKAEVVAVAVHQNQEKVVEEEVVVVKMV
jgi:hypothetical protein